MLGVSQGASLTHPRVYPWVYPWPYLVHGYLEIPRYPSFTAWSLLPTCGYLEMQYPHRILGLGGAVLGQSPGESSGDLVRSPQSGGIYRERWYLWTQTTRLGVRHCDSKSLRYLGGDGSGLGLRGRPVLASMERGSTSLSHFLKVFSTYRAPLPCCLIAGCSINAWIVSVG